MTYEGLPELSRRALLGGAGAVVGGLALGFAPFAPPASAARSWWHPFPAWATLTSTFYDYGADWYPNPGQHRALDYDPHTGSGTPVYAISAGTIVQAGWSDITGLGNTVQVDLGDGYRSLFAHLHSVSVSVGNYVSGGTTVLGRMGATGGDYPPHLHVEVWTNSSRSNRIDPLPLIGRGNAPLALSTPATNSEFEDDMAKVIVSCTDIAAAGGQTGNKRSLCLVQHQ